MERDENGKVICPYNHMCGCEEPECHKCGWHPDVARHRLMELRKKLGLGTKLYHIPFTGHCLVWADSAEEAIKKAEPSKLVVDKFGEPVCLKGEDDELD